MCRILLHSLYSIENFVVGFQKNPNKVCSMSVSWKVCGLDSIQGNFLFFLKYLPKKRKKWPHVGASSSPTSPGLRLCARSLIAKPLWACWVRVCCSQWNWTEAAPDIASGQQMGLTLSLLYRFPRFCAAASSLGVHTICMSVRVTSQTHVVLSSELQYLANFPLIDLSF